MSDLRLGVLGLSEGNGHPYSWSAIFNGYDPQAMASCPFPVIPDYLARQTFPQDAIAGARVTHVWTQSRLISEHLSAASLIEHIVDDTRDMIGQVDAVLLARDDAEKHLEMSRPFLEAGLPVFIDKPIALNRRDLDAILALEKFPGQVFSCSALRYAQELHVTPKDHEQIGPISFVYATTPKKWSTYAVHIIEPVLLALGDQGSIQEVTRMSSGGRTALTVLWSSGVMTIFATLGSAAAPVQMTISGDKSSKTYTFSDTFPAFRASLAAFFEGVQRHKQQVPREHLETVVEIIERGAQP